MFSSRKKQKGILFVILGETVVAICTSNGQLLEFSDKKIVNGYEIDCSDARSLQHFVSYNPVRKYYLVQTSSQLIVISRQKELKVYKTFEDVLSVEVKDLMGLGRPQIVIKMPGQEPPIVTDLVGTLDTSQLPIVQSKMSLTLQSKLQEVNLRLSRAKNVLQEKRNCRTNAMVQFAAHLSEKMSYTITQGTEQVTVVGSTKRKTETFPSMASASVQVSLPWQRVYCSKWIVGVPVQNTSLRKLLDIGMILNREDESPLQYKSYCFVFSQVEEPGIRWTELLPKPTLFQPASDLAVNSCGVVISVLDEPTFRNSSSIKLSGVVVYNEGDNESECLQQVHFSPVELKISDLVQGKLKSFSSSASDELDCDLLSCIVVCSCSRLEVQLMQPSQHTLEEKLEQNLGFVKLPSLDYFVCKQRGALEDVIVKIERASPWQYVLSVHTSEERKTMLFIHSLQDLLPQHASVTKIKSSPSTIHDAAKSLNEELLLLLNTLSSSNKKELPLSGTNTIELSEDTWANLKEQLFRQEIVTDQLFNKLPVFKH